MSFSGYIGKFGGEVNSLAPLTGPLAYLLAIAAAKWAYDDTQQSLVVMSHGNRKRDRRRLSEGPQIKIRTIPCLDVNGLWGV